MPRPNTEARFNPAYSTVKAIYLQSSYNTESVNILIQNTECQFERLELVENVNDVFPNGVIVVRDTKDIVGRMKHYKIDKATIEFVNGTKWNVNITSVGYLNNAASETEENYVGLYISNLYYQKVQKTSLNQLIASYQPLVFTIKQFVDYVKVNVFGLTAGLAGYSDPTSNYVLYKPLNTIHDRIEAPSDNPIEYLNYLAAGAVGEREINESFGKPQFMFWTEFDGSINFKYFHRNPQDDPSAKEGKLDKDFRRIGIYEGDAVVQKLSDKFVYRKAYFYNTNPGYQFISKNYYYIRKTPKILDRTPANIILQGTQARTNNIFNPGACVDIERQYHYQNLAYQFQDEGQRYNIEVVDNEGLGKAVPGADQLIYDKHWGYYDGLDSINSSSSHTLLGQNFGTQTSFGQINFMGLTGLMPFVDNTEMWKNMFDMTEIHPNYPEEGLFTFGATAGVPGSGNTLTDPWQTKLQYVMNVRYETFANNITGADERLKQIRNIELQNFIMYSLCCMGNRNESFLAALTAFQEDLAFVGAQNTTTFGKKYRYKWNKLVFGLTGTTGSFGLPVGGSGASCGSTYYQVEYWGLDPVVKSSETQDDTWAINLNERGITPGYVAPGWVGECIPSGFEYRPIGAQTYPLTGIAGTQSGLCGSVFHVVRMHKQSDGKNSFYYFTAENVIDGCCPSGL
jgi:hypothetical protein